MSDAAAHFSAEALGEPAGPGRCLVAFLAGDRASYISGASIDVGGGMGKYL
jgi:NAD(P)-dependent dehydrogenase (short-subunit alcohol dehydrogenase family)